MSVEEQVRGILLDILDVSAGDLVPGASLRTDLGASSIDLVEVIAAMENEFDMEISDEDAEKMRNVGDIIRYVEEKTA
jgi:acyl carrier protein